MSTTPPEQVHKKDTSKVNEVIKIIQRKALGKLLSDTKIHGHEFINGLHSDG